LTAFTFTAQDLMTAPAEVRRWLIGKLEGELLSFASAPPASPPVHSPQLAACTPEEAAGVFDLLKGDFAATHVFFELANGEPQAGGAVLLHAVNIGSLIRNTRINDQQLASCLNAINRAFQEVRGDPEASLFAFDRASHVYVHETTCQSIRSLWGELMRPHAGIESRAAEPVDWLPPGFQPRQLGPSDDIATHHQH